MVKPRQPKRPTKLAKPIQPEPLVPYHELYGLFLLALSFIFFLSVVEFDYGRPNDHLLGIFGYTMGGVLAYLFGISGYWITLALAWIGWKRLWNTPIHHAGGRAFSAFVLFVSLGVLLNLVEELYPQWGNHFTSRPTEAGWAPLHLPLGGSPLHLLYKKWPQFSLHRLFNTTGIVLFFSTLATCSFLFLTQLRITAFASSLARFFTPSPRPTAPPVDPIKTAVLEPTSLWRYVRVRLGGSPPTPEQSKQSSASSPSGDLLAIRPEKDLKQRPSITNKQENPSASSASSKPTTNTGAPKPALPMPQKASPPTPPTSQSHAPQVAKSPSKPMPKAAKRDCSHYQMPSSSLLTEAARTDTSTLKQDLRRQAEVLEETLHSFGIEAKVGDINCGPTITSFEVHPAIGVKVQKIKTLENDIALNMEARSIRIIAPIPGKAAVGIEVPNAKPQEVSFKEMLQAYQSSPQKFRIPLLLGKAVNGDYVMSDLSKMPHCIIAGATGSGKSVCINTIIMSIVFNARPDQIRLLMVDPKKVELTPYTKLPHMLAPVITEPKGACAALHWLVKEMEKRYDWLKLIGVRNIESFNHRKIDVEAEKELDPDLPPTLPYIVAIIDELADLMMVSSHDIETPITRIAQMARAVGIHLILATQRPSREVITGIIKANFPTRISFKVSSRINSQIILDESGAELLLGNGDMLFLPPASSHLIRAQGSYVRDEDIQAVIRTICDQMPPNYAITSFDELQGDFDSSDEEKSEKKTPLFLQAVALVQSTQKASATFLQQRLKIGYPTAARLMDEMEEEGIISPIENGKMRRVLMAPEETASTATSLPKQESTATPNNSRGRESSAVKPQNSALSDEAMDDFDEDEELLDEELDLEDTLDEEVEEIFISPSRAKKPARTSQKDL